MLNNHFVGRLQCPRSGQSLGLASQAQLDTINSSQEQPWEHAVVTQDQALAYPVINGIPLMLPEHALTIS